MISFWLKQVVYKRQTANNYGEVLFELGIKKDTVEESKRIFSLTEQLHRTLESPIISKNEKYSII